MKTEKMKIEMQANNMFFPTTCAVTQIVFEPGTFVFKVINGENKGELVCESIALENGFTISKELFNELESQYTPFIVKQICEQ